jgi:hypothetical protein
MRKALYFLIVVVIQLFLISTAYSKKENIITKHNEYGGKTEEKIYESDDKKYKEGIDHIVTHYNNQNLAVKIDYFYTEDHSKIDGIYRRDQSFEYIPLKGTILKKSEYYYTDAYSDIHGLTKTEIQYDDDGNNKKEEFFYTDAYAKRKVYSRVEVLYETGNPEKRIYYDKNNKVILTEEKKKVWKSD